jgi:predicted glycoside hydrolase/deacetylase ChbG (UPF0249 family)
MIIFFSTLPVVTSAGETWSERLGFPAGKRVLILHANDLGGLYEIDRPAEELLRQGRIQSAGVTVLGPWFHEFAHWYREHPGNDVGVALTMVSPSPLFRWRPASPRDEVASLVDGSGYLWSDVGEFAVRADAKDAAQEIQAQIDLAKAAGVDPTHLMTFQGGLLLRPDLLQVYLDAAEKNGIPAVMIELSPENLALLKKEGIELARESVELVNSYQMPKIDAARSMPEGDSLASKKNRFMKLVRDMPPGITQIFVAPSDPSEGLERLSRRAQQRVWDAQLLQDQEIHAFLREEGVLFTNWIEVLKRYQSSDSPQ